MESEESSLDLVERGLYQWNKSRYNLMPYFVVFIAKMVQVCSLAAIGVCLQVGIVSSNVAIIPYQETGQEGILSTRLGNAVEGF